MKTEHTPGEWNLSKCINDYTIYQADTNRDVALVYRYSRSIPDGEAEANAKLIAAAPEMLSALQATLEDLQSGELRDNAETFEAALNNIERTIYKATQP